MVDRVFAYNFNDQRDTRHEAEERGYWKDVGTLDSYYEAKYGTSYMSPRN